VSATFTVLAAAAANAGVATLLLLAFSLFGFALLPARLRPGSSAIAVPVSLSVGSAAIGWSTWIVGSLVGTWALAPLWIACALFSLTSLRPWGAALGRVSRRLVALVRATPLLAAVVLAAAAPLLLFSLAIPLVDNDGIRYHVALPKLYLLTGRIFLYEWDVTGAYPALGDALYLVGLVVKSQDTAKFLHAGFLAASLAVLALTLHRGRSSRSAALAGPLLFLACPAVGVIAGTGFIDHIALFHLVAAFALVRRKGRPLLVGICLGAALATKLTIGPAAGALALVFGFARPRGARVSALATIAACSTVILAPFLVRNVVGFGDPVFPIGYLATGRPLPGVGTDVYNHFATFNRKNAGPLGVVWQTPDSGEDDETAGIHNLAGLLLLFFGLRDRLVRLAACVALPFLVYAAFTSPPTRYLLPMFWGLSLAAAAMLARLVPRRGAWLAIPLALPGLFVSWDFQARNFGAADYLLGRYSKEEYLARTIPGYRAAPYVNSLPPGGVMVGDFPGPVYFNRPWIVEGLINEAPLTIWIRKGENADRLLARLHENGIRWLLATPAFGGGTPLSLLTYAPDPTKGHIMAALRARLRFVKTVDGVDIWEVPAPPSPAKP
jgi:hypothetical protein